MQAGLLLTQRFLYISAIILIDLSSAEPLLRGGSAQFKVVSMVRPFAVVEPETGKDTKRAVDFMQGFTVFVRLHNQLAWRLLVIRNQTLRF